MSLEVTTLPEYISFLDVIKDIDNFVDYDMSIHVVKLDTLKILNELTYSIASKQSEIYSAFKNQKDYDVLNKSSDDAIELRKKIQIDNEGIYNISIIFTFSSSNLEKVLEIISKFKAKLYSKNIYSQIVNFRHLDFFLLNLPLNFKTKTNMYITTSAISNIFPYISNSFIEYNGVIFGTTKISKKICMIDMFSNKYENSNMVIIGSSGSGKSFFTKLLVIRNYFSGKKQIILDYEKEYFYLTEKLEGEVYTYNKYINILEIFSYELKKENTLLDKVNKVAKVISSILNVDIEYITKKLYELYSNFGITEDKNTYLTYKDDENIFLDAKIISSKQFPTLNDLVNIVEDEKIRNKLKYAIKSSLLPFSETTNIDLLNYIITFDSSYISNFEALEYILYEILDFIGEKETLVYIDEMWKYAKDERILLCISNMYKTIRKRKAGIIGITQDITDFFTYNNGIYAKSILNNSCFKVIFKTEYLDKKVLDNIVFLEDEEIWKINKGEAILAINSNTAIIQVTSTSFERGIFQSEDSVIC